MFLCTVNTHTLCRSCFCYFHHVKFGQLQSHNPAKHKTILANEAPRVDCLRPIEAVRFLARLYVRVVGLWSDPDGLRYS